MVFTDAADFGGAPEIFISGVSRVEQLGPGTVRVTFYSRRDDGNVVVLHAVWDMITWQEASCVIEEARWRLKFEPRPTATTEDRTGASH